MNDVILIIAYFANYKTTLNLLQVCKFNTKDFWKIKFETLYTNQYFNKYWNYNVNCLAREKKFDLLVNNGYYDRTIYEFNRIAHKVKRGKLLTFEIDKRFLLINVKNDKHKIVGSYSTVLDAKSNIKDNFCEYLVDRLINGYDCIADDPARRDLDLIDNSFNYLLDKYHFKYYLIDLENATPFFNKYNTYSNDPYSNKIEFLIF
jgi:hypothetical protein